MVGGCTFCFLWEPGPGLVPGAGTRRRPGEPAVRRRDRPHGNRLPVPREAPGEGLPACARRALYEILKRSVSRRAVGRWTKRALWRRQGGRCALCAEVLTRAAQADHTCPLSMSAGEEAPPFREHPASVRALPRISSSSKFS